MNFSFNEILFVFFFCKKNSTDSDNSSMRGSLSLINAVSHKHGLAVYLMAAFPFAWETSYENYDDSYLFDWPYQIHCLVFLSLYR